MNIRLLIKLALLLALLQVGLSGTAQASDLYLPMVVRPEEGALPLLPFPQTGDLYLLYDGTGSAGQNVLVRISPDKEIKVVLFQNQILAATGALVADFDDADLAVDKNGAAYFTEPESGALLKWSPNGPLTVLATRESISRTLQIEEASLGGLAFGWDGLLYATVRKSDAILRFHPNTGEASIFITKKDLSDLSGLPSINLQEGIVRTSRGAFFVLSTGTPDAILHLTFEGVPTLVINEPTIGPLLGRMTRAPNGDILATAATRDAVYRITPNGTVTTLLSTAALSAVTGVAQVDLEGAIAFDSDGNLYVMDEGSESILRFDPALKGEQWLTEAELQEVTGFGLNFEVGLAFIAGPPPDQ